MLDLEERVILGTMLASRLRELKRYKGKYGQTNGCREGEVMKFLQIYFTN